MLLAVALLGLAAAATVDPVHSVPGTGFAVSIGQFSLDYFKQIYLPPLYSLLQDFRVEDKSAKELLVTFDYTNIKASFPEPEQQFIKDWKTELSPQRNSLTISNKKQNFKVEADVHVRMGKLKLGHAHATMNTWNMGFNLETEFATQDSTPEPGTGLDTELAPALNLLDFSLDLSRADSDIKLSGGLVQKIVGKVVNMFRGVVLRHVVKSVEKQVKDQIFPELNQNLTQATHFSVDGFGIDFAQLATPLVSDDKMLTFNMNGTFYDSKSQENHQEAVTHRPIEVGTNGKNDFMIHMTQEVATSLTKAWSAANGLNFTQLLKDSPMNHTLTYDSVCWINSWICHAGPSDEQVNFIIYLDDVESFHFLENAILFEGAMRFRFETLEQRVLGEYQLQNLTIQADVFTRKEFNQIYGGSPGLNFTGVNITDPGLVDLDVREILRDDSSRCNIMKDTLNDDWLGSVDSWNNRYKQWGSLFFEELQLQVSEGMIMFGFELDPLYLGRPQNWNPPEDQKSFLEKVQPFFALKK